MTEEPTQSPEPTPTESTPEAAPDVAQTPEVAAAPAPPAPEPVVEKPTGAGKAFCWGTGRRKAAVARVRVRPGEGKFVVNRKDVDEYFRLPPDQHAVRTPLNATGSERTYDVFVRVAGGGTTGQAGAIVLGLARALVKAQPDFEGKLRDKGLLSRDPRRVERKKYGQRGARRRFQFSKR